ncbi:MAG: hypothetical protein DME44_13115 [Verrucomicrobia bacterium]|nr:MAG: hypothetical protein DME44_13115 [Verrucomicrobiota bacterium]
MLSVRVWLSLRLRLWPRLLRIWAGLLWHRLQQQLARAGYYRGPIDGIMGSRTRYALRAYHHDHGTASL